MNIMTGLLAASIVFLAIFYAIGVVWLVSINPIYGLLSFTFLIVLFAFFVGAYW